jgi:hypothetical protein
LLHLDPAPQKYDEDKAHIIAFFERVKEPFATVSAPGGRMLEDSDNTQTFTATRNGKADYEVSLTNSKDLVPGKWRLSKIGFGQSNFSWLAFTGDASFEIQGPRPILVHIDGPPNVAAGQPFMFNISLDHFPTDVEKGCAGRLIVSIQKASPMLNGIPLATESITSTDLTFKFAYRFPPDFNSAEPWEIALMPAASIDDGDRGRGCRYPELRGDVRFPLRVKSLEGLVTPKSAAVLKVNPAQIEILRLGAKALSARLDKLKVGLASRESNNENYRKQILDRALTESINDLQVTKEAFISKEESRDQTSTDATKIFFADIRLTYDEAAHALEATDRATARPVAFDPKGDGGTTAAPSELVLSSIDRNIKAYDEVAKAEDLDFSLFVQTEPQRASFWFRRKGSAFQPGPDVTNTVVRHQTRAFYYFKFHLDGYKDKEMTFDASTNDDWRLVVPPLEPVGTHP